MAALDLERFEAQPVPDIARILSRLDRAALAQLASAAIDLLDMTDDDPDLELCGDEADCDPHAEDEFAWHGHQLGAGCPCADPDLAVDDFHIHPGRGKPGLNPYLQIRDNVPISCV